MSAHRLIHAVMLSLPLVFVAPQQSAAEVLYDAMTGTLPSAQGWNTLVVGSALEFVADGVLIFDTTAVNATQGGYSRTLASVDSTAGFTLSFTVGVIAESHSGSVNRAGFSIILLDDAHRGVELGFWTDQIWAQAVGFAKAESVTRDTTQMATYQLGLSAHGYTLSVIAGDVPVTILSGPLRDYTTFPSEFAFVYAQNRFLFLGDDTRSAKGSVRLRAVSTGPTVSPVSHAVPVPAAWLWLLGILMVGFGRGGRGPSGSAQERWRTRRGGAGS